MANSYEGQPQYLPDGKPIGFWYSLKHFWLGRDAVLAASELANAAEEEAVFRPDADPTFRQASSTTRIVVGHAAVMQNVRGTEYALQTAQRVTSWALSAASIPYRVDQARDPRWELMHHRDHRKHALEAHVDTNAAVIVPIEVPKKGGELVVASDPDAFGTEGIENDTGHLVLSHHPGQVLVFPAGLVLPHYVRPHGGNRTMLVANVPVVRVQ